MGNCQENCKNAFDDQPTIFIQKRNNKIQSNSGVTNLDTQSNLFTVDKSKLHRDSLSNSIHHQQLTNGFIQFKFKNGSIYQGEQRDGLRHGWGKQIFADGSSYQGQWQNDMPYGRGIFIQADGGRYQGEFKDQVCHGNGHYVSGDQKIMYEGQFQNDVQNGFGTQIKVNQYKYTGNFKNQKKDGIGTMIWSDGRTYEGLWKQGQFNGHGRLKTKNSFFQGNFKQGKPHLSGRCTWGDGSIYEGEYNMGKKEGFGKYKFVDGRVYQGNWKNGKQHGQGELIYPDGQIVTGNWFQGKQINCPDVAIKTKITSIKAIQTPIKSNLSFITSFTSIQFQKTINVNKDKQPTQKKYRKINIKLFIIKKKRKKGKTKNKANTTANFKQHKLTQNSQNNNDKRNLQIQYMKVIEELYKDLVKSCKIRQINKTTNSLPQTVVYFLGSVLKKISLQRIQLSYLKFIDECIKVFRKSTYNDVKQFIKFCSKEFLSQQQQTKKIISKPLQEKKIEINANQNIKKNQLKTINPNANSNDNRKQTKQNIYDGQIVKANKNQLLQKTPIKQLQCQQSKCQSNIHASQIIQQKYNNRQNAFFKIPISSSVQSKKIQQTPNLKTRTENSKISTPIQKIEELSKSIQKCLKQSYDKNMYKKSQFESYQRKDVFNSNKKQQETKISPNKTFPHPFYSNSSSFTISNQKKLSNNYLTMHLQQKYGYISKNINARQNKTNYNSTQKYYSTSKDWYSANNTLNLLTNKDYGNDDRIDRLTQKLQKHIDHNARKIQRSQQVRNLQ